MKPAPGAAKFTAPKSKTKFNQGKIKIKKGAVIRSFFYFTMFEKTVNYFPPSLIHSVLLKQACLSDDRQCRNASRDTGNPKFFRAN